MVALVCDALELVTMIYTSHVRPLHSHAIM